MKRLQFLTVAIFIVALVMSASARINAQNTSAIRGRVVDAQTHQPLAGVRASAYGMHGTNARAVALTTSDGSFKLDGLGPGLYRLELSKNGFRGLTIEGIAVRANEVMIIAGSIAMLQGETAAAPTVAEARNSCGNLVQQGVTADVYVVCGQIR